jgi:threonine synthase
MIWQFSQDFSSFTFTDDETIAAMKTIYAANGYS